MMIPYGRQQITQALLDSGDGLRIARRIRETQRPSAERLAIKHPLVGEARVETTVEQLRPVEGLDRTMRRWLATSASAGASLRVG